MKATTSYLTWQERIASGVLTKSQTNQFTHAIATRARGEYPRGRHINITVDEAKALVAQLRDNPVRLTDEHTTQGITWFARHAAKALSMPATEVLDVVDHFDHFSWDGSVAVYGVYANTAVPVWTVHLDDKRELRYHYAPWVNGVDESDYTWTEGP